MCVSSLITAFASFPKLLVYLVVRRCLAMIKLLFKFFVAIRGSFMLAVFCHLILLPVV